MSCYCTNPVLLPEDVKRFSALVRKGGLSEDEKPDDYARIAGRIALFHDVIARGLSSFEEEETSMAIRCTFLVGGSSTPGLPNRGKFGDHPVRPGCRARAAALLESC
jgi:hypothetical protein